MSRRLFVAVSLSVFAGCALLTGLDDYELDGADSPVPDAGDASTPPVVEHARDAQGSTDSDSPDVGAPDAGSFVDAAPPALDAGVTCDEPGLIARWTFDETSGELVRDCTSHGHDGVLDGGAGRGGGHSGGGLVMDAGGVRFGPTNAFELTTAISICAWSRVKAFPPDLAFAAYIASKSTDVGTDGWRLGVDIPHGLTFSIARGGGAYVEIVSGPFSVGIWLHACGVFKPGISELYVNGALSSSSMDAGASILNSPSGFTIGNRADGLRAFNGAIDEVRIYDRALSAADVLRIAQ